MSKVRILPESLINKIAAGEVVDRPFSVVKELMENAVDAGADRIFVTIRNGGKEYISVLDNGCGMSAEDAQLAIERHATSKIATHDDLESIGTMGFRGEALAAIAAVSRFELTTCRDENEGGFQVRVEGGKPIHAARTGFPKGSRINVENLFFNTPARRKFMKSEKAEYGHIHDLVIRLSLGYPHIQFKLVHNKSIILNLAKGSTFTQRVRQCCGDEIADDLMECRHKESYLSLSGLISLPSKSRTSRRWQYTFVNDRHVKCLAINHGVYEGYKTLLMKNMHPMFFLQVNVSPAEIDVNVHPAKTEIRVKNPNLIHTIIANTLASTLKMGARNRMFAGAALKETEPETAAVEADENRLLNGQSNDFGTDSPSRESAWTNPSPEAPFHKEVSEQLSYLAPHAGRSKSVPNTAESSVGDNIAIPSAKNSDEELFHFSRQAEQDSETQTYDEARQDSILYRAIGQLSKRYIVAIGENCLLLVDQHAAHERIRFEEIRRQFYAKKLNSSPLLIPLVMELPPQDGVLLEQYREEWEKVGFRIDHFGGNDYSIREIPTILQDRNITGIVTDVLDEAAQFGKSGKLEAFFNQVFEKMACHSSVRAGQELNLQEMQSLLDQLVHFDLHLSCPHGRSFLVEIAIEELDRRCKRIV